jgi:hypothetical protein
MTVVLFPVSDDEPSLQPGVLGELARLGITNIALLRDSSLAGLVLEGWAFDPQDAPQAAYVVAGAREGLRMLQPVAQLAVTPAATLENDRKE